MKDKIIKILHKLSDKIHIRMIASLVAIYFIAKVLVSGFIMNNINKEIQNNNVSDSVSSIIKEGKELLSILDRFAKLNGASEIPMPEIVYNKSNNKIGTITLKGQKLPGEVFIPVCGSKISANVIAKDSTGANFANETIEFTLGEYNLPAGLERSIGGITTGYRYDIVVPTSSIYFIQKPDINIAKLKPSGKAGSFITYSLEIDKIDKSNTIHHFEPRIFYLLRGNGAQVSCGDAVGINYNWTTLDSSSSVQKDALINIGSGDIPTHLENILMRLKTGDSVSVLMSKEWLQSDGMKKLKPPISVHYAFLEMRIISVKESPKMFAAKVIE